MSGYPCYKMILCGRAGESAMQVLTEVGVKKSDDEALSPKEFQEIVDFMEMVEDRAKELAEQISGVYVKAKKK